MLELHSCFWRLPFCLRIMLRYGLLQVDHFEVCVVRLAHQLIFVILYLLLCFGVLTQILVVTSVSALATLMGMLAMCAIKVAGFRGLQVLWIGLCNPFPYIRAFDSTCSTDFHSKRLEKTDINVAELTRARKNLQRTVHCSHREARLRQLARDRMKARWPLHRVICCRTRMDVPNLRWRPTQWVGIHNG